MSKEQITAIDEQPCIGLFGTCGPSTFRGEKFIPVYESLNISYFNPQLPVGTWKPENAITEADHLAHDVIQCWPVTGETYGFGSLAEVGFSIANSLRAPTPLPKIIIPMIEMELGEHLTDDFSRQESMKARVIAQRNLDVSEAPILQVRSLDEMLEVSVKVFPAMATIVDLMKSKNPAFQRFREGRNENIIFSEALKRGLRK